MQRITCTTNLVQKTTYPRISKLSTCRLFSTYCVAVLSATSNSRVIFSRKISRCASFQVTAFIPTTSTSLQPFRRRSDTLSTKILKMSTSTNDVQKRVLVPIADGSEEIETACITDTLTRFGAKVTVASVTSDLVCTMSRGLKMMADCTIDEAADPTMAWDMIVLPGGMPGAEHLRDCSTLQTLLQIHAIQQQKPYGAICAAPAVVLASSSTKDPSVPSLLSQIGKSTTVTCYPAPAFRAKLADVTGIVVSDDDVVVSDNLITSQGPATALAFSLQLGQVLYGVEKRNEIAKAMLTK